MKQYEFRMHNQKFVHIELGINIIEFISKYYQKVKNHQTAFGREFDGHLCRYNIKLLFHI